MTEDLMTQATATKPSVITDAPIHPSLAVKDLAHSRDWYADKVGWEPTIEAPGTLVYVLESGSAFTLYESEYAGTAKNTVMNWVVADLPTEVDRLRGRGVTFEEYDFGDFKTVDGIMTDPTGFQNAWFKDPDGDIVGLVSDAAVPRGGAITTMIAASDLDRAKAWYADKLGFHPTTEMEGLVLDYRCGDSRFEVYKTDYAGTAKNTVGVWRLVGLRDEVARLRANGVVFEEYDFGDGELTVGGILSDATGDLTAWFKDSEGNILSISEDRN
ncbi:MAG TPA: VOC family protein [Candidatus Limnocylindrales bacterium]|jgi:catechol 2,3-dioxygenase-like lactoylglutathione lyase family enzyme